MKKTFLIFCSLLGVYSANATQDLEITIQEKLNPVQNVRPSAPTFIPDCGQEACLSNDKRSIQARRKIVSVEVCFEKNQGYDRSNNIENGVGFEGSSTATIFQDKLLISYNRPVATHGFCQRFDLSDSDLTLLRVEIGHRFCQNWISWPSVITGRSHCTVRPEDYATYIYSYSQLMAIPRITKVTLAPDENSK